MPEKITVLIADDSALMRKTLREIVESDAKLQVVGTARDGEDLLEKARNLRPDVITLDINMPRMDGLTALEILVRERIAPVVMVSSLTQAGASVSLQALEMGAFDCVAKPGGTVSADMSSVARELIHKLKGAAETGVKERLVRERGKATGAKGRPERRQPEKAAKARAPLPGAGLGYKAVAIGLSTGGPRTIFEVLPQLPATLNAAIFLVQHLPPHFTASFAERLDKACAMRCVEAQSGMEVAPGTIYLGQGGRQVNVLRRDNRSVVLRTPSRPVHVFMPSVDVMMHSVLAAYGSDTVGVLMTGMGDDGAEAMVAVTNAGGITIAESEESAVVWGMPGAAVARGGAQFVAPSWEIAERIVRAVR